jgi:hypothetical protein
MIQLDNTIDFELTHGPCADADSYFAEQDTMTDVRALEDFEARHSDQVHRAPPIPPAMIVMLNLDCTKKGFDCILVGRWLAMLCLASQTQF